MRGAYVSAPHLAFFLDIPAKFAMNLPLTGDPAFYGSV
ncbi:hypothetical protein P775_08405 [Puniceibacterium antarcticum]|uniref:Uncharacterized protein n=1 Tax=Puniceibacterium antarcticum TaxID=1206336 RepID=A0A2G8RGK8_9RHOB|nr:hypothetical protein P775_08405 [Puniceibacterium antarcticum]